MPGGQMAARTSKLLLVDLMRLVEADDADTDAVIKASFDWEHTRRLEIAKWLLATGATAIIAVFALLARQELPSRWILIVLPSAGGLLAMTGYIALHRASVVHSRFVQTSILCARLKDIQPFLQRLRHEGEL
jgi:hypothetical protein